MRKWLLVSSLSLLVILFGTGCTMKTIFGEKAITEQEVIHFLPQGAELYVPAENQGFSKWGYQDIDQDGAREIYAFYRLGDQIGVVLLEQTFTDWEKRHQVDISHWEEISYIDWKDVNQDERLDLIVGQERFIAKYEEYTRLGHVKIYSFQEEKVETLLEEQGEHFIVDNLDEDPYVEVVLLKSKFFNEKTNNMRLFKYKESGYQNVFSAPSPGEIGDFDEVQVGKFDSKRKLIFLSGDIKGTRGSQFVSVIQLLFVEKNELKLMNTIAPDGFTVVAAEDVDHDGFMEIGLAETSAKGEFDFEVGEHISLDSKDSETEYYDDHYYRTESWMKWKNNKLVPFSQVYKNDHMGIKVKFPASWINKIHVYSYKNDQSVGAKFVDATVKGAEKPTLFTIVRVPKDGQSKIIKKYKDQPNFLIGEKGDQRYLVFYPSQQELQKFPQIKDKIPTKQELREMFELLPE